MKKIVFFIMCMSILGYRVIAQPQQTPAQALAMKQAKKFQDSLGLSNEQRRQLYKVNMDIFQAKTRIRQKYEGNMQMLTLETQKLELGRDSLYKQCLPAQKYSLYLQKKRTLLSN